MDKSSLTQKAYELAKAQYAELGIDTDKVLEQLDQLPISMHCWQADDVGGFEKPDASLDGGGIQVTGNYPGKARTIDELRADIEMAMSLLPGKQRLNLHAIYGDFKGKFVEREQIEASHFQSWIDWAREKETGLDFNPSCFSHPYAADGFTLSSKNETHRRFWVEHVKRTRTIAAQMGKELGTPCINNIWIPDGSKDIPVDSFTHRALLKESLDEIIAEKHPKEHMRDAVECKLFGIGSEAMVVGSHEFYMGYAIKNNILLCLDNGHFHPTEQVGDKISSVLQFIDGLLLHITRGVRWDSDHIVTFNDEVKLIAQEVVRANALGRVNIGLDFFDATLNRVGAYVAGVRATQLAFLYALLEPTQTLKKYEQEGKLFERLALLETLKTKPFGDVYNYWCLINDIPVAEDYIKEVQEYEREVLAARG